MTTYFNPLVKAKIMQTNTLKELADKSARFKSELIVAIGRFLGKDWGDVTANDVYLNNKALHTYQSIRAEYQTHKGTIVVIAFPNTDNTNFETIVVMQESEENSVCISA